MAQRAEGTTVGIRLHPSEWGLSASDFLTASHHMVVMLGELDIAISDVARRSMDWRIAHISYLISHTTVPQNCCMSQCFGRMRQWTIATS